MTLRHIALAGTIFIYLSGCGGARPSQAPVTEVTLVTIGDGEDAIENEDFQGGADIFTELLTQSPNDPVIHYYLGYCKDRLGDQGTAEAAYKKAIQLDPNLTNARLNLGLLLLKTDKIDEAIAELTKVEQAEPDAADVQYNLAMAFEAAGKTAEAKTRYEKSAIMDPEDPEPIIALGDMEKAAGNNAGALALYEKAETIGAGSTEAIVKQAQLLISMKKTGKAVQKLLSLTDMDTDAPTLSSAGLMLAKLGKTEQSITLYKHTTEVHPSYAQVNILLGNALARQGNFAEAATYFQKFLELAPNSPKAAAAQKGLDACNSKL